MALLPQGCGDRKQPAAADRTLAGLDTMAHLALDRLQGAGILIGQPRGLLEPWRLLSDLPGAAQGAQEAKAGSNSVDRLWSPKVANGRPPDARFRQVARQELPRPLVAPVAPGA
jgi:hypothetical protein